MGFKNKVLVCATIESETKEDMVKAMDRAKDEGADLVELCMDSVVYLHISDIELLFKQRTLPTIVSFRLNPENKSHKQDLKHKWLQILRLAIELNVEFIEIDFELASSDVINELMRKRDSSKIIVSSYVKSKTGVCCKETLGNLLVGLQSTGADIVKVVTEVAYITDVAPVFHVLTHSQVPVIVRAVGDRGLISQLLGPKYGAFMVCGSLSGRPIPGLPSLLSLKNVYKLDNVDMDTKVFGVVSNPVGHSKGPLLHNPAFRYCGFNGIYVPLLVDNLKEFLRVYSCTDFAGFSIGLPHKEAAVACCDEVDPLAKSIGAVNTIVRRPSDGKLVGYNTDCDACITAIEDALRERQSLKGEVQNGSPISGRLFVLVGAGGAGRALAFGAKSKGAHVVIFNRNFERAQSLARAVSGEALPIEQLDTFCPQNGMILANCSAIGMEPDVHLTPVSKENLRSYDLVFDAVYTPRNTRLLREAVEVGVTVVSGVEMFIRQALGQFKLFTNGLAPEDFMRKVVLEQF
ncbi:bifunctional 3-dehydroquinate dehydratase/shikimate dehydrogenase, chloroplastic-like [Bidens hawaiensis]|uniref:bifunctional 3-dehydroquinate dehydratase/shikimate dehydrogenase, chloroplastic-like n=1 Tax=Bidens hawaiensis TaxID=980011 RepID=UPI00404AB1B3